jgi:hypothetical protein
MYKDIVIVSAVRTPFGRYCGSLREYDFFDLGALPMKEVITRVNVSGEQVDEGVRLILRSKLGKMTVDEKRPELLPAIA